VVHRSHAKDLQAIKLLWAETIKANTRVHFAAGDRVLRLLAGAVDRVSLMSLLLLHKSTFG
jgi:hypothetical protein